MSLRQAWLAGLAAHAVLLLAALRHCFVWGAGRDVAGIELHVVLGALEGLAVVLFALLAGIPYALAAPRAAAATPRALVRGGAVLALAAVLVPPFLSTDVWDNLARGRVEAVYGANPYLMPPAQYPEDPFTQRADYAGYRNPYGPMSALVQAAVVQAVGDHVWAGAYLFKLLCAACHVLTAWCLYLALAARSRAQAHLVLYLWLWNPWILLETAGSAHNDALLALGLAVMAAALARARMVAATVAFGLAVLTKHSCAVLGPLLLALAWRRRELLGFAGGFLVTALLTAVLVVRYFLEPGALDALTMQASHQRASLQHFAALLSGAPERALTVAGLALAAVFALVNAPGVRDLHSFGYRGARVTLVLLLVGIPMFSPWYHLWWLPLAGLWAWSGWPRTFGCVAVLCPLAYVVYAATRRLDLWHQITVWSLGLLPVAALVLVPSLARRGLRDSQRPPA